LDKDASARPNGDQTAGGRQTLVLHSATDLPAFNRRRRTSDVAVARGFRALTSEKKRTIRKKQRPRDGEKLSWFTPFPTQGRCKMTSLLPVQHEVDQWFSDYFKAFIDIGAGRIDPAQILLYWGVPLHTSGPKHARWLNSPDEVVGVLNEMQGALRKIGYTHTEALDKTITVYSENAARVETIMSRRRADDTEVDRAAVSFELRRTDDKWAVISTTARPTDASLLREIW
jgi:hypothetical protein